MYKSGKGGFLRRERGGEVAIRGNKNEILNFARNFLHIMEVL